jgi:hypothetical protein
MIVIMYEPVFVFPNWSAGCVGRETLVKGFAAAMKISVGRPPPSGFDGLMSATEAKAKLPWSPVPGYAAVPPGLAAFAALFGSLGWMMKTDGGAAPPVVRWKEIAVYPSKKTVRFPWFDIRKWNKGPLLFETLKPNWALVMR